MMDAKFESAAYGRWRDPVMLRGAPWFQETAAMPPIRFNQRLPRTKGDGVEGCLEWLKGKLPPTVFESIGWVQPSIDHVGVLELGFWDSDTTVVLPRRGFRCAVTIARICLEAP